MAVSGILIKSRCDPSYCLANNMLVFIWGYGASCIMYLDMPHKNTVYNKCFSIICIWRKRPTISVKAA